MTLSITNTQHNNALHYAVIMLNVAFFIVMLSAIMLNVVMLSVVAPFHTTPMMLFHLLSSKEVNSFNHYDSRH
jgi:hypothetical protein